MRKLKGCHFYVNIVNLDEVVTKEEATTGNVTHAIHALDTFFTAIEVYSKKKYSKILKIEKITGSRLHMYVVEDVLMAYEAVSDIATYAYALSKFLNENIGKFKSLTTFKIQIGSCYGKFYDFIFESEYEAEETTIGYAANYAAKLQHITDIGWISISENIYEKLQENKDIYYKKTNSTIKKYDQEYYYTANIAEIQKSKSVDSELEYAKELANRVNLSDINFQSPSRKINFGALTKKEGRKIEGVPLFADVRGFTKKFEEDDSNLEEMAKKTQDILTEMYNVVNKKGIHVQFQGDREFALYHNYDSYSCYTDAVTAGMRIIDAVRGYGVCVGVGQSVGRMFVSKIGTRGEKDIVVLGKTVMEADSFEDDYAKENQLVIARKIYQVLERENPQLANQFQPLDNSECYYTTVGYKMFLERLDEKILKENSQKRNYNGAWKI